MSIHFRVNSTAVGSTEITVTDTAATAVEILLAVGTSGRVRPVQLEWGPHLAALMGILVLMLLGGVLIARNRFASQSSLVTDPEAHDEEFLTDREKVQRLIRENGGRMKQSKIVDSVDWSKAKVSRLLAELEDEGRITKLRLGRENLVCLPGHEPTASQSPEQPRNE